MPRIDPAHHFGALTARVLDRLRLIENQQMVTMSGELLRIAPQ